MNLSITMCDKLAVVAVRQTVRSLKGLKMLSQLQTSRKAAYLYGQKRSISLARTMSTEMQPNLQHFKVQPLPQTLSKFLQTVKPLLVPEQYQRACQLVDVFGKQGGDKLQQLLEAKANSTVNWLEDWWLNYAYLDFRAPVPIHVNPGILTPRLSFSGKDEQLRYAANLVARLLEYKKMIDSRSIPIEKMRDSDLCMRQYYRILGCCRVPCEKRDAVVMHPGGLSSSPRHITVIHNGHIFSMNVYNNKGQPLTSGQLYQHLLKVLEQSGSPSTAPIGILTTEHRDNWSKAYARLSQDPENLRNLENIQSSIVVLSLDQAATSSAAPAEVDTIHLNQMNHGGGSRVNSANRWFDKTLQAIVTSDGRIGFNYEHSAAEGPAIVHLIDFCFNKINGELSPSQSPASDGEVRRLNFKLEASIQAAVDTASKSFDDLIGDLELIHFSFDKFGKGSLKTFKVSPDAFIQVAFQLVYYRLYGCNAPSYESGSLRRFRHGRTETIRSCSQASDAYCRAMVDPSVPTTDKAHLLREAIKSHSSYTEQVSNGQGVDRHLLGLKLIAEENGLPLPDLLKDPVYENTCYWKVSTSQVPSKSGSLLCFGPVVPDGYGICYNPMETRLLFSISTWKSCDKTSAQQFAQGLDRSLSDGLNLLSISTASSKL